MGVVAFALLLAILVLVRLMRRSRALQRLLHLRHLRRSEKSRMMRLGFYLDMLEVLERGRLAKPPWRPPRLHAITLEAEHPQAAALVGRITDVFYAARYGGRPPSPAELRHARALVGVLARVVRRRVIGGRG
jgi:hypothetical protein